MRLATCIAALGCFFVGSVVTTADNHSEEAHVLDTRQMHEHSHPSHHVDKATRGRHAHKAAAVHHSKKSHHSSDHKNAVAAPHHGGKLHYTSKHNAVVAPHHDDGRLHHASKHKTPVAGPHHDGKSHHASKHDAVVAPHHDDGKRQSDCKPGLGWTDNNVNQKPFQKGACWCYNWSPWPCSEVLESVAMLWSLKQLGDWNSQVKGKHHQHILAINEPEQKGQSNMSPGAAVSIWREHVMTVSADQRGSPAVTTSPAGFTWITTFLKECTNCKVDFVCLHYYGITAADFITQITKFHNAVKKPIWVTEWACQNYSGTDHGHQCTAAEVVVFMRETQAWMDKTSWIIRYAYYGAFQQINIEPTNRLMSPSGAITSLGKQYLGY